MFLTSIVSLLRRIVIIRNEVNLGLALTLNKGIEYSVSKGAQYIVRMDSDDISTENRLVRQLEFMERNPKVDISGGSVKMLYEDGNFKVRY